MFRYLQEHRIRDIAFLMIAFFALITAPQSLSADVFQDCLAAADYFYEYYTYMCEVADYWDPTCFDLVDNIYTEMVDSCISQYCPSCYA